MQENKVLNILHDIEKYESKDSNFNTNVSDRLNKTLENYMYELDRSLTRLKCKETGFMVKELGKQV